MKNFGWLVMGSLSTVVVWASIILSGSTTSSAQGFQTAEIDVDFTNRYTLVWTDRGSGAAVNVSFWRPEPPSGWFRVGHHVRRGHQDPTEPTIIVRERVRGALARPLDYFLVWDDTGSGAANNGSVWRPGCPNGYSAMGDLTNNSHAKPSLDEVACVRESSLATATSGNEIWNDSGSGAVRDFAAWGIVSPAADMSFTYASSGLFFGAASHNRPQPSGVGGPWAAKLPKAAGASPQLGITNASSADQQFWDTIKNSNNAQDFQSYLSAFPNGQFAPLARFRMGQQAQTSPASASGGFPVAGSPDQQFWDSVKNSQNASDFQGYLNAFPNGEFAALARFRIGQLAATSSVSPAGPSRNAALLNQIAATNRAKLPMNVGDIQLLDAVSICQSGCQQSDGNNESILIRGRTPNIAKQRVTIGQIEQSLKGAMLQGYCGSPEQTNNITFGIDVDDMFQQKIGMFFLSARDCSGLSGIPVNLGTPATTASRNAAFLNNSAAESRMKLPITLGQIQLFDAVSHCQFGCQVGDNTESVTLRARTPSLTAQNVSIEEIDTALRPVLVKSYCGTPEQKRNIPMFVEMSDRFNQEMGRFVINSGDCGGNAGTGAGTASVTGFQQVIASAQPGSLSEIARARTFFVVSSDFSIKSKIAQVLSKELPQLRSATSEQTADFLIAFELTDRKTGLVTANNSANPDLRGEMIVFIIPPGTGNRARILFRITKERGFGVFSAMPYENAAKEFAKQFAKVII